MKLFVLALAMLAGATASANNALTEREEMVELINNSPG